MGETEVVGVATNAALLQALCAHPAFVGGEVDTGFIERHRAELFAKAGEAQDRAFAVATLARLLDSLEAQGLVTRVAVPEDRRAKKIALQPKAQPLIEKIEAISTQLRQEVFAGIDEEDLRRCQQVHARVLGNLLK